MKTKIDKLLLVVGIVIVALLAVIVYLLNQDKTGNEPDQAGNGPTPPPPPPPLATLGDGQTVTSDQIKEARAGTAAPASVDTSRLAATYEVGKTYGALAKVSVQSRGTHKDWGISTDMNFTYLGELQLSRHIEENDGRTMTVVMQVDRAVTLAAFTQVEQVKIELGPLMQSALELSGPFLGLPPGWTEVGKRGIEELVNIESSRDFLSRIATDENAKAFASVDSLQGKRARVVIENGVGVKSITAIDSPLDAGDQLFFESLSFYSDVVLMQDLDCRPGDSWQVSGRDLMTLFDPSMNANVEGTLTIRRGDDVEDGGGAGVKPKALLTLESGVLKLRERHSQRGGSRVRQMGSWAPTGAMIYDFGQSIVTEAKLAGSVELVEESTDHILFQMKSVIQPIYEVQYSAWTETGNRLEVDFGQRRPPAADGPALLDRLGGRLAP